MGIAALGFCSFEGMHCSQVVIQHNATPPLQRDFGKSLIAALQMKVMRRNEDAQSTTAGFQKINH